MVDVFEAVADPTRRTMLDLLADGERAAGELGAAFPTLSQPSVSRHLRTLREAGLVDVRVDAQRRIYILRPDRLAELDQWLHRYRAFWTGRLDALEHLLDSRRGGATSKRRPKR